MVGPQREDRSKRRARQVRGRNDPLPWDLYGSRVEQMPRQARCNV